MISNRLKLLRTKRNITQAHFAKILGVARTTYAMYEQGQREPDFKTLIKIADYFDVTLDYLLGREEKKTEPIKESLFPFDHVGISQEDFENLSVYQQEVLEWAVNADGLFFKDKSDNVLDMMERLEIAYEVDKVMKKRRNNN